MRDVPGSIGGFGGLVRLVTFVAVLAAAAVAGCGDAGTRGEGDAVQVTARDSAGVRIVESSVAAELPVLDLTARPPLLSIGALDGREGEVLYRVTAAFPVSDGRLVIGNAGSHQIRFYDVAGRFELAIGGEGEGPGEFREMGWVGPAGDDSVAAYDGNGRRIAVFDPGGVLARTFSLPQFTDDAGGGVASRAADEGTIPRWPRPVGRLASGSFVVAAHPIATTGGNFRGITADSVHYYFLDGEGEAGDRAPLVVSGGESWMESTASTVSLSSLPFGRDAYAATGAGLLWIGVTDSNDIRGYAEDGSLRTVVRRDVARRPVTEADIERYKERDLERAADNPDWLAWVRDIHKRVQFASRHPLFSTIAAPDDGGLWVEEYSFESEDTDPSTWTAYDADGRPARSVVLPPNARILWITGDTLILRREDELSVEYVEVYGLERTAAEAADGADE